MRFDKIYNHPNLEKSVVLHNFENVSFVSPQYVGYLKTKYLTVGISFFLFASKESYFEDFPFILSNRSITTCYIPLFYSSSLESTCYIYLFS